MTCKAARNAALAAITICRGVEVHAFQSNVLQLIINTSLLITLQQVARSVLLQQAGTRRI
jgi:hypothetical protein